MRGMKAKENVTRYEDFKYVLQDTGSIYLGAGFSYGELLLQEMIPFKLKTILSRYVLTEASADTTLESQFYYLQKEDFLYGVFEQLKSRVKTQVQEEKRSLSGKKRIVYRERIFTLRELTEMNLARKKAAGMLVQEVIISKMGMMTFSV